MPAVFLRPPFLLRVIHTFTGQGFLSGSSGQISSATSEPKKYPNLACSGLVSWILWQACLIVSIPAGVQGEVRALTSPEICGRQQIWWSFLPLASLFYYYYYKKMQMKLFQAMQDIALIFFEFLWRILNYKIILGWNWFKAWLFCFFLLCTGISWAAFIGDKPY